LSYEQHLGLILKLIVFEVKRKPGMIKKGHNNKINWSAFSAIVAVLALITTVIISGIQMKKSRELFEKQFMFDTSYSKKQFVFDTTYIHEQLKLMKSELLLNREQFFTNDSIARQNLELAKKAITHEDQNKSKIIPQIMFIDLMDKHWNLKRIEKLLNEKDSQVRIDYVFKTKLNTLTFNSISIYDLFLAFNSNPKIPYQIINIYGNINKIYEGFIRNNFNSKTDTLIVTADRTDITADTDFPINGTTFNDIHILKTTLMNIEETLKAINIIYKIKSMNELNSFLCKEVSFEDIAF
jgi:hypothetical protein